MNEVQHNATNKCKVCSICLCYLFEFFTLCVGAHIKLTVLFLLSFIFICCFARQWWPCYRLSVCDTKWRRSDECGSNRATVYSSLSSLKCLNILLFAYAVDWMEWTIPMAWQQQKMQMLDFTSWWAPTLVILLFSFLTLTLAILLPVDWLRVRWTFIYCLPWYLMNVTRYQKKAQRKQRKSTLHDDSHKWNRIKWTKIKAFCSQIQRRAPPFVQRTYICNSFIISLFSRAAYSNLDQL